jgi:hypothetical protein
MVVEITGYDRPRWLASSTHLPLMDIHSSLTFTPVPGEPGCSGHPNSSPAGCSH